MITPPHPSQSHTPEPLQASLTVAVTAASPAARTITGRIVSYGQTGHASTGPTQFRAGSLAVPTDLSAVKLLIQHDTYAAAVGFMTSFTDTPDHADATFTVAVGASGDQALAEAKNGARDGLSVGAMITDYDYAADGDTLLVSAATLREVSLVTLPAYPDARVTAVTTAHTPPKENTMPTPAHTPTATVQQPTVQQPAVQEPAVQENGPTAAPTVQAAQAVQVVPPGGGEMSLVRVSAAFADGYRRGTPPQLLTAALNDILPANDAGMATITRPQWVDELWQASRAVRPFFDKGTPQQLSSLKVQGWKIDLGTLPTIDPYAGAPAAIPSSSIKTVPVSADAVRRAGGWDFDRAFVDLGDGSFITQTLAYAMDDYKRKTEAWLVSGLLAAATTVQAGATFAATLAGLGVAAVTLGARLDIISMATDQWLAFAGLKESEVPWWLRSQGELHLGTTNGTAGGLSFECDPELPAGTILAADSRAYTPYEKGPIQVEALNIPNGGIDLGVFSYIAAIVNDPRAVLKVVSPAGK